MNHYQSLSRAEWIRAHKIANVAAPPPLPRPVMGSRVSVTPTIGGIGCPPMGGTVVYINDKHLYYTVLLDVGFLESYKWGFTQ